MEKLKGPREGCNRGTCGWRVLLLPQLNRQSLYVYGSEVAVEKECVRQLESGVFVIHPFSPMRYLLPLIDSGQPRSSHSPCFQLFFHAWILLEFSNFPSFILFIVGNTSFLRSIFKKKHCLSLMIFHIC